VAPERKEDNSR